MMRLPEFLEDRKVFLDEPLVSMFAMRRQRSVRRIETGWTELFADAVEKAPNGLEAVKAWLSFANSFGESKQLVFPDNPIVFSREFIEVFVDFFWTLSCVGGDGTNATPVLTKFIKKQRKNDPGNGATSKDSSRNVGQKGRRRSRSAKNKRVRRPKDNYDAGESQGEEDIILHAGPRDPDDDSREFSKVVVPSTTARTRKRKAVEEREYTAQRPHFPDLDSEHQSIVVSSHRFHRTVAATDANDISPLSSVPESESESPARLINNKTSSTVINAQAIGITTAQQQRKAALKDRPSEIAVIKHGYHSRPQTGTTKKRGKATPTTEKLSKMKGRGGGASGGRQRTRATTGGHLASAFINHKRPSQPTVEMPRMNASGTASIYLENAGGVLSQPIIASTSQSSTRQRLWSPSRVDYGTHPASAMHYNAKAQAMEQEPPTSSDRNIKRGRFDNDSPVQHPEKIHPMVFKDFVQTTTAYHNLEPNIPSTTAVVLGKRKSQLLEGDMTVPVRSADPTPRNTITQKKNNVTPLPQVALSNNAAAMTRTLLGLPQPVSIENNFQTSLRVDSAEGNSWVNDSGEDMDVSEASDHEMPQDVSEKDRPSAGISAVDMSATGGMQERRSSRPPLLNYPPIWAKSRQEVCESFEWFRSYQGGVYFSNDSVKGYLLSAFGASRDAFHHHGKLIISHGGGKHESLHTQNGQKDTQLADDQLAQDKSVRALINNYEQGKPLVLLVDDKYALFPFDLAARGVTYAVLGFYKITHTWAEFQTAHNDRGRVVRYKFCFQWCEDQGRPWWIPQPPAPEKSLIIPTSPISSSEVQKLTTLSGDMLQSMDAKESNTVVSKARSRPIPVKIKSNSSSDHKPLKPPALYHSCRLCSLKSPHIYVQGWMCVNPVCAEFWKIRDKDATLLDLKYTESFLELQPTPSLAGLDQDLRPRLPKAPSDGITTTYAFTKGWHCRRCGRLSTRYMWEYYKCANCPNYHRVSGKIRSHKEFWSIPVPVAFQESKIAEGANILPGPSSPWVGGSFRTFTLPDRRGRIHLIKGTAIANLEADKIFRLYQEQAADGSLRFRRWPLRAHKVRGELLTNYFSQNTGEPYQYVGGTANTVPFDEAPTAVISARELIQNRAKDAIKLETSFNEVLSAAYMEKQKMAFHSDSEKGLGPVIGSLSLGSPALMHFRLHSKYDRSNDGGKRIALTLLLRHGDVVIMEGAEVQIYYEHTVIPFNFRIAATARSIGESHFNAKIPLPLT